MVVQPTELTVGTADAGQRLDRFLRKLLRDVPLGAIFRLLRTGRIRVDGRKAEPGLRLEAGMRLVLKLPPADLHAPEAAPAAAWSGPEPRLVHRDEHLLVVDKPAGMAAQPGSGAGSDLTAWLLSRFADLRTPTFTPAPAHRLDRAASGLLLVGLTPAGLRGAAALFRDGKVEKVYLALVRGAPEAAGQVDAPLLAVPEARAGGPKVRVDSQGQEAHTAFTVLAQGRDRALLRVTIATGRMHQIRAHLAHIGHPIVGDLRYGGPAGPRLFLHASELRFAHPVTGVPLVFRLPAPRGFAPAGAGPQ